MPYAPRRTTFVPTSTIGATLSSSTQHNTILASRIAEKKQELESLIQLRDLSSNFAAQMVQLQEKLATLVDGTEAVALIVSNWDSILRAINLASANLATREEAGKTNTQQGDSENGKSVVDPKSQLPEPFVRIRINKEDVGKTSS
ncbi:DASH complex subunit Dad2-domain-containing protein [Lipomyces chichibuensis]|uniref:DASH complex subunit Dad2-domain-containing protein n=1 Tax=Lipomyces chichibuensis TaxID=1546026 RepID=UPI003342F436